MSRSVKYAIWSAAGLLIVGALCAALFLNFDWNRSKPWLTARISEALGRPFAINGDLSLNWDRAPDAETGWRGWVPWPNLLARDITVGNPDWAQAAPGMASIAQLTFSLNPVALLEHRIVIPSLRFDAPNLTLERAADGRNNWSFMLDKTPSAWRLDLRQIVLNKGSVRILDAVKHADIKVMIDSLDQASAEGYGVNWHLSGRFNGENVSGSGKAGAVLSLQNQVKPYPIEALVHAGKTTIHLVGSLTKPSDLAALDMRLKLSGASMAQLYPLTGIVLPETPPFSTEGHLVGVLNRLGGNWIYDHFSGKVGSSDLAGSLEYQAKRPRPLLRGNMASNLLQFRDLAPVVGADSNASKAKRGAPSIQPANRVLPTEPLRSERWTSIDADIKFSGRKIIRDKGLPIDNLTTNVHLLDGVLSLTPLDFGVAGGNLSANIKLDGRDKTIKAETKIAARSLKLKQLFPDFRLMDASLGELNGDASLSATGNSIAHLLGSSNGEIKMLVSDGTISKLLLEEIGLNIGSVVVRKLFGDRQVALNCMAADFTVTSGVMQVRNFIVDTDQSVLHLDGSINLAQEQLDLKINPYSKGPRLISLRSPLYVTGSFKNPAVNVDKGVLALKGGSAIALAVLAPIATALMPLASVGRSEDSGCAALLIQARTKPVAPAPGHTYRAETAKK